MADSEQHCIFLVMITKMCNEGHTYHYHFTRFFYSVVVVEAAVVLEAAAQTATATKAAVEKAASAC